MARGFSALASWLSQMRLSASALPSSPPSISRKSNELMDHGDKRRAFSEDVVRLGQYILNSGRGFALDWAYRDPEIQKILVARGLSKVQRSNHNLGLAVDLNVYPGWDIPETYRDLGAFWESLDPQNRWGGRFGARFRGATGRKLEDMIEIGWDARHFERRP